MQKTLLLYSRICPAESQFTIKIFDSLKNLPNITAIKIDGNKPFDVEHEQKFIKSFDNVIILFTMNWFNLPWNFIRYMAEVWRTGPFNLEGINFYTIVTTGSPYKTYTNEGFGWSASDYLNNLSSVFKRLKANYKKEFFFYDCANKKPLDSDFNQYIEEIKLYYLENINK